MSDEIKGVQSKDGTMIKGEVLRVEGDNYFVKGQYGKEVRMHIDKTTQRIGNFQQGDRIEPKVNDKNHALSIRSARGTDAGTGKETARDRSTKLMPITGNDAGRMNDSALLRPLHNEKVSIRTVKTNCERDGVLSTEFVNTKLCSCHVD